MEAHSLVCSPREFGEGKEDENGSIRRGELGCLHPWRSYDNLGPIYFMVISIAWRRAHMWRRVHH
jgi:hypothetical protein